MPERQDLSHPESVIVQVQKIPFAVAKKLTVEHDAGGSNLMLGLALASRTAIS
jgi:hypothetical protein